MGRLELPQLSPHAPQACVSTIPPRQQNHYFIFNFQLSHRGGATASLLPSRKMLNGSHFTSAEYHVSKKPHYTYRKDNHNPTIKKSTK